MYHANMDLQHVNLSMENSQSPSVHLLASTHELVDRSSMHTNHAKVTHDSISEKQAKLYAPPGLRCLPPLIGSCLQSSAMQGQVRVRAPRMACCETDRSEDQNHESLIQK